MKLSGPGAYQIEASLCCCSPSPPQSEVSAVNGQISQPSGSAQGSRVSSQTLSFLGEVWNISWEVSIGLPKLFWLCILALLSDRPPAPLRPLLV